MDGSEQFAAVISPEEKTLMSPAVVVSTAVLLLGFVAGLGYQVLVALG